MSQFDKEMNQTIYLLVSDETKAVSPHLSGSLPDEVLSQMKSGQHVLTGVVTSAVLRLDLPAADHTHTHTPTH